MSEPLVNIGRLAVERERAKRALDAFETRGNYQSAREARRTLADVSAALDEALEQAIIAEEKVRS